MNRIRQAGWALLACASMSVPLLAETVEKPADKSKEELEQRVQALEKKIQDLEAMLDQQRNNTPAVPRSPRRMQRYGRDMDELFDRFQREFEQRFERDQDVGGWMGPMGPGDFGMQMDRKPRLGVEMAPISEDLVERYKNPVKEGVFITSIVPGSPAETAGMMPGDAVTSFNNRDIKQPQDLIDAVRSAPKGKNEIKVTRKGEGIKLSVTLAEAEQEESASDTNDVRPQNWLRRDSMQRGDGSGRQTTKTEVHASALEMTDNLAKDLKLTDDQKKKMSDILSRHAKALSDEFASSSNTRSRRGSLNLQYSGDIGAMAQKHADAAEKDLAAVLNADQLKQWNDWRRTHSSVSTSYSATFQSGPGGGDEKDKTGF